MRHVQAIVDGHVHVHRCYQPDAFFDTAYRNLQAAARDANAGAEACYLLLAECASDDFFGYLRGTSKPPAQAKVPRQWRIEPTAEETSVAVSLDGQRLFVVAGRQVACREGLEVLILGTAKKFVDGRPIRDVLTEAQALGVPHVIPWGLGKWTFGRGRLLHELVREFRRPTFFLGDEGGRPWFLPYPRQFHEAAALGVRDLPGTDPLPFRHDLAKVGRMGFRMAIDLDEQIPAASLFRALCTEVAMPERFAKLEPVLPFVRNQLAMQLRKRQMSARSV